MVGGMTATGFSWAAPDRAGDTSPAHFALTGSGDAVATVLRDRKVSDNLPSSAATLICSASSAVTSRVTVRPKPLLEFGVGRASSASIANTRMFWTIVSPTDRRVIGVFFISVFE